MYLLISYYDALKRVDKDNYLGQCRMIMIMQKLMLNLWNIGDQINNHVIHLESTAPRRRSKSFLLFWLVSGSLELV